MFTWLYKLPGPTKTLISCQILAFCYRCGEIKSEIMHAFWFNNLKRDLNSLKSEMSELRQSNQRLLEGNQAINETLKELLRSRNAPPAQDIPFGVPFVPRQSMNAANPPTNAPNPAPPSPEISNKVRAKWLWNGYKRLITRCSCNNAQWLRQCVTVERSET